MKEDKIKKTIIFRFVLTLLCFVPLVTDLVKGREYYEYREGNMINAGMNEVSAIAETVSPGDELRQTFLCMYEGLTTIVITTPQGQDDRTAYAEVKLVDDSTREIFGHWDINTSMADENGSITMDMDRPGENMDMKGKELSLIITGIGEDSDTAFLVNAAGRDYYENGCLTINGTDKDDDLFMTVRGYSGRIQHGWVKMWLCIYLALIVNSIYEFIGRKKLEKVQ